MCCGENHRKAIQNTYPSIKTSACRFRIYFPNYEDPQIRDSLKRCLVRDPGKRPNANQLLDAISGGRFDDEL